MYASFSEDEFLTILAMFKWRKDNLSSYVHVLHKTSHWEVSRRSRAVDVNWNISVLKGVMHVHKSCFAHKINCFLALSLLYALLSSS